MKSINQCLCLDIRAALPCDSEVPSVCTFLPMCTVFAAGWFNVLLFQSINELATLSYPDTTRYSNHTPTVHNSNNTTSGDGSGYGGTGVLPIGTHLVIPVHSTGPDPSGNDTGIQYAEVIGSVDEHTKSDHVQYAQAVSVDRSGML